MLREAGSCRESGNCSVLILSPISWGPISRDSISALPLENHALLWIRSEAQRSNVVNRQRRRESWIAQTPSLAMGPAIWVLIGWRPMFSSPVATIFSATGRVARSVTCIYQAMAATAASLESLILLDAAILPTKIRRARTSEHSPVPRMMVR
jgi:hypothetical protein